MDLLHPRAWFSGLGIKTMVAVAIGATVVLGGVAGVLRARPLRNLLLLAIPTLWVSFAVGTYLTVAAGPAVTWRGQVHIELGEPMNLVQDFPADCTSPDAKPDQLAHLTAPPGDSGPHVFLIPKADDPYFNGASLLIEGLDIPLYERFFQITMEDFDVEPLSGVITFNAVRSTDWLNPDPAIAREFRFTLSWDCEKPSAST